MTKYICKIKHCIINVLLHDRVQWHVSNSLREDGSGVSLREDGSGGVSLREDGSGVSLYTYCIDLQNSALYATSI